MSALDPTVATADRQDIPGFLRQDGSRHLVVLLHAYGTNSGSLNAVCSAVLEGMPDGEHDSTTNIPLVGIPDADIFQPPLDLGTFSRADPNDIARTLLEDVNGLWKRRPDGYEKIILVGHSTGAALARKLYLYACGSNADAPLEPAYDTRLPSSRTRLAAPLHPAPWAGRVDRLILLAAMNRGWTISDHLARHRAILWWIGSLYANAVSLFSDRRFIIYQIRRGAPFLTQLRMQWLAMRQCKGDKRRAGVGTALTVQLLGTVDDMVAPSDNIDLVTGRDFVYLDVPESGHANIREMGDHGLPRRRWLRGRSGVEDAHQKEVRLERRRRFLQSLCLDQASLREMSDFPTDEPLPDADPKVSDVVFVIHGIRDEGFWTQRIARKVKARAAKSPKTFRTETSSYGYFAMLPFVLPWTRRAKVEWLMDQYTENKALYPNADFSFVGHSNGTYLLARALKEYPACRFKHVVFAGSVVNRDYDWQAMIDQGRVKRVLNYVATRDWVVAFFPKGLGRLRLTKDLGGAGHDGFVGFEEVGPGMTMQGPRLQVQFVRGGHSAALNEQHWQGIAEFVVNGSVTVSSPPLVERQRGLDPWDWLVDRCGRRPELVLLLLIALAVALGVGLYRWAPAQPGWAATGILAGYVVLVWRVLTRV